MNLKEGLEYLCAGLVTWPIATLIIYYLYNTLLPIKLNLTQSFIAGGMFTWIFVYWYIRGGSVIDYFKSSEDDEL